MRLQKTIQLANNPHQRILLSSDNSKVCYELPEMLSAAQNLAIAWSGNTSEVGISVLLGSTPRTKNL